MLTAFLLLHQVTLGLYLLGRCLGQIPAHQDPSCCWCICSDCRPPPDLTASTVSLLVL
jgi:hypothetical protein